MAQVKEGYYGDLSDDQDKVLKEFQELVRGKGWQEQKDKVWDKNTDDDYALLRYLRARKFELTKAVEMRTKNRAWRKKFDVDNILKNKPKHLDLVHKLVPQVAHGYDKKNRPISWEKLGKSEAALLTSLMSADEYLRCHIWKMETLLAMCEESSKKTGTRIETFSLVLDLTGVRMGANESTGFLAACSENDAWNYPERLGRIFVINTPWVFPFIWKVIAAFIDTKTKNKISVLYGKYEADLQGFIEDSTIPKEYGGKCECKGTGVKCITEFDVKELKLSDMTGNVTPQNQSTTQNVVTVPAGQTFSLMLNAKAGGGTLHWFFRVEDDYNVNFSVECQVKGDKNKEIVKKPNKIVADQGMHTCHAEAAYTLIFDNTFSYFKAKVLQYQACVIQNDEKPTESGDVIESNLHNLKALNLGQKGKDDDEQKAK